MPSSETLLTFLFVFLYLYDSVLLLDSNEAILKSHGKDRWAVRFGSNKTTWNGKELYLCLWPTQPLFRVTWELGGIGKSSPGPWTNQKSEFKRFVPLVWSLAALTFGLLPFALFGRRGDLIILLSFLLIYFNVLSIVLVLWFNRQKFGLSGKPLLAMSLDLLICPPFALNIIRRLSLRVPVQEDLIYAARRLQTPDAWELTKIELLGRLDDEIASEDEDTPRMAALMRQRTSLDDEINNVFQ
jgi:hypothetical protein